MQEDFANRGYLYSPNFYDLRDVEYVKAAIYELSAILLLQEGLKPSPWHTDTFDRGVELLSTRRRSQLYDGIKKHPDYIALAFCERHRYTAADLLMTNAIGIATKGYGLRMDFPLSTQHLTQLHQDYTTQLSSPRGVVFWSPLRDVTLEMGPPTLWEGSHKKGIAPIAVSSDESLGMDIYEPDKQTEGCQPVTLEVKAGDALIMDMLLLHQSNVNMGAKIRWAMISRYFDFSEPTGIKNGWKGGLKEGGLFREIHPELTHERNT